MDRWTALYLESGIFEQYNPETGAPYGVEGLGMRCVSLCCCCALSDTLMCASTLIVDWLIRLGRTAK
jgi:hypothetical protein